MKKTMICTMLMVGFSFVILFADIANGVQIFNVYVYKYAEGNVNVSGYYTRCENKVTVLPKIIWPK